MAIKIPTLEQTPVTLDEFIRFLETSPIVDKLRHSNYDISEMQQIATWLRALAANKEHLLAMVATELSLLTHFQVLNTGQSQGFILHRTPYYTIRLMVWIPSGHQARSIPFSYDSAHDHAFDLMSAGFFGPGYRTSLYSFDYEAPAYRADGLTRLDYKGDTHLKEGEVIYYYANKDVHTQHAPASLSASLNLIIVKSSVAARQTIFDLEDSADKTVKWGRPRFNSLSKLSTQRSIFSVLSKHGNARSRNIITKIARDHELDEVRTLAWAGLLGYHDLDPAWAEALKEEKSRYVRNIVNNYQSMHAGDKK